ncbi:MAG: hypothetical protein R6U44_08960 [Archaeoglobaceae archaeon]
MNNLAVAHQSLTSNPADLEYLQRNKFIDNSFKEGKRDKKVSIRKKEKRKKGRRKRDINRTRNVRIKEWNKGK